VSNSADSTAETDGTGENEVVEVDESLTDGEESGDSSSADLRETVQLGEDEELPAGESDEHSAGASGPSDAVEGGQTPGAGSDQPTEGGAEAMRDTEPTEVPDTPGDADPTDSDDAESGGAPRPGPADEPSGEGPPDGVYETVQMEAIDRTAIEREGQMRQLEQTLPLLSSRFAPEIVVASPRKLVGEWREGWTDPTPSSEPEQLDPGPGASGEEPPDTPQRGVDELPRSAEPPEAGTTPTKPPTALDPSEGESSTEPLDAPRALQDTPPPPTEEDDSNSEAVETPAIGTPVADGPPEIDDDKTGGPETPPTPEERSEKDEELSEIVEELVEEEDQEDREVDEETEGLSGGWVQEVFGELYLATVPETVARRTKREADFIEESLGLEADDNVLDLACGFGRHTIELVSRDYDVVGFDLSKPLLQKGLEEAKQRSLKINFFHGDMRNLDFHGVFDACFCWQSSFGYFEDAVNLDVLARVNRALLPEGRLLLDVMNRDYVIRKMPHRIWWEGEECLFLEEGEFDFEESILHMNRSFIYEDGRPVIEQDWHIRLYSPHELRQILGEAGLRVTELSGSMHYRGDFIGRDSPKLIARAEKVQSLG